MSADWFSDPSLRGAPRKAEDFDQYQAPMEDAQGWASAVSEDPTATRTCKIALSEIGKLPHLLFAAIREGTDLTSKDVVPILEDYLSAVCPSCFTVVNGNVVQLLSGAASGGRIVSSSSDFDRLSEGQCPSCESQTYIAVWHGEAQIVGAAAVPPAPVDQPTPSGFRLWMLIPALGAVMVLAVFLMGLQRGDANILPSALLNKPVPEFVLSPLRDGQPGLSQADMKAPGVKLLNIWASWCGPCRAEHPNIEALAAEGVTVHGLNYKDAPENAEAFLNELGDPYTLIGTDENGRAGIEFGVYGVPETFVVNAEGLIVYKHVGPILGRDMEKVRAAIKAAGQP